MFDTLKKWKYVQFILFQKLIRLAEKKIILLIIPNEEEEGWHYLVVKKFLAFLKRITSKHHGDFCYLNCLYFFRTENKLKPHVNLIRKYVKKSGIGIGIGIVMPSQKDSTLKFHQYIKSEKMRNNTYADLESFTKKIDGCANNLERSSTTKLGEHIPCRYSMSTVWTFYNIENKHSLYCGEDRTKKFLKRAC